MTDSDLYQLVLRVKKGEIAAFDTFFDLFYDPAVAYAWKLLNDKDQARDAAQEVFIRIWQKRFDLDPEKPVQAYVLRSIRNHCFNVLRDRKKTVLLTEGEVAEMEEKQTEPDSQTGVNLLLGLIKKLPERQREALELSRFEGQSHDQIADIMHISARTVNNHIVQALKFLRGHRNQFLEL